VLVEGGSRRTSKAGHRGVSQASSFCGGGGKGSAGDCFGRACVCGDESRHKQVSGRWACVGVEVGG
jgi:hypothetical protein